MDNLRIEIRYAVLISLLTLLWLSIEFMVGLQDVYAPYYPVAYWLSLIVIPAIAIRMGVNEKSDYLDSRITFKQAFSSGFLIAFFAAVLTIPVQLIFHKLINPDFFDTMISYAVVHAENLKQNAIEAREEAGLYFNLTTSIIQSGLGMLVSGTIIALITARLMRSDN